MAEYYISSNKYSLQERQTKRGRVYDVVFRIITLDGDEKQKKLSGFTTKALAKQAYVDFVTTKCELVKNNPIKKKDPSKKEPTVRELLQETSSSSCWNAPFITYIVGKLPLGTVRHTARLMRRVVSLL